MTTSLLTPKEVAARLKVSLGTVKRLLQSGKLASIKLGRNTVRVHPDALTAYIEGLQGGDSPAS